VRDSGLVHQLAAMPDLETLLGHPLCGPSWEGFVVENILALLPHTWRASYYRTGAQAEIDLVLEGPRREVLAIEIKRSLTPELGKGYRFAFADVGARRGYFVMPRGEKHPLAKGIEAIALVELVDLLRSEWGGPT
jgi:predicted AAA+ superfamily ATPase